MKDSPTKTICFFNSNKAWGGGEKWHLTTAKEFSRKGFNTFLVTNSYSQLSAKAIQERMNVFRFHIGNLTFLNPLRIFVMALFLKTRKVDAIILNLPADLKFAGLAAKLAGIKKIIYRRGMPHPLRNTWLNRLLFQKVLTHVVVNSKEIGRSLSEGNESWFPVEKMVLIYNGVDVTRSIDKAHRLYNKMDKEIIIGNAGRLTEQKGQKYLIQMARLLKAQNVSFKLLIAGEGELHLPLQKLIDEAGLQNEVKLLGHVSDMSGFLNSLDVFVFTSLYEGSANTLIETLEHGIPTIAWNCSSNPEIIEHNETGILVKTGDVNELVSAVINLCRDQELKNRLSQNGQKKIITDFNSHKNLEILSQILN